MKHAAQRLHPEMKVIGGDMNAAGPGPALHRRLLADARRPSTKTWPTSSSYCQEQGIGHVIPTRDGELAFWSRHRAALAAAGIAVLVSEPEAVQRCFDKLVFAEFWVSSRACPLSPRLTLECWPGHRPACGHLCSEGAHGAGSLQLGLNLPAAALAHAHTLQEPIFQPFIAGQEISVDAYVDRNGQVRGLVARTRDLVVRGESQVTTTILDPALAAQLTPIVEKLGLYGPLVLQAMLTDDGGLHLIECNCRFGGASTLGIAAGVDSFFWFLQEAAGADLEPVSVPARGRASGRCGPRPMLVTPVSS